MVKASTLWLNENEANKNNELEKIF